MDTTANVNSQKTPDKKSPPIFRILWRSLLFLFLVFTLLISSGIIMAYYYQDEVKEYIIGELNKKLNTQIIVDGKDINFTVLKNFPLASVDFKSVKSLDATQNKNKDTLFKAERISLQFNIIDVFKKNYHIKKIEIDSADLRLRIDKNGKDNYHIWKTESDTGSAKFSFDLEKIVLRKIQVSYKNYKAKQNIEVFVKNSKLSGKFSDEKYSLQSVSDLLVKHIKIDSTTFLRNKNIHEDISLEVDNSNSLYKIKSAKIKIEKLLFEAFGDLTVLDEQPDFNLKIQGKEMNIKTVLSLIPNRYKEKINDYESEGEFYFNSTVQGKFSSRHSPKITANFGINNARITQIENQIILQNVNLKGHYSNGEKGKPEQSKLSIIPFSATINGGDVSGELSIQNLHDPAYSGKIKASIHLDVLQQFIKIDTIEKVSGQLIIDAAFKRTENRNGSNSFEKAITTGNLEIQNMYLKLKNNNLEFQKINGNFSFDNNDLKVNLLKGNVSSSDFELKGFFRNMIGFILRDNQDILIEATLNSKHINLDEILTNKVEQTNETNRKAYKLKFSEHINVKLTSEIQQLTFRKFDATNIKGLIKLNNKKLILDPVSLNTMNGTITTSGLVDGSDSTKLLVTCFSEINKINITKMFESFENFGQTAITNKNIKGLASAKIQFAAVLSPDLKMEMDKLYAGIDMTIENGELNNVESMKSLSRFIELKELENIRFATLKNQIEIKNRVISIPKMEIKSSAINITTSGTHTFNNEIDYKIKLSLNDILSKKAKQAKKQNDEFGEVADDGLGRTNIFLSMTGTLDNPTIKYDTKSAIQNIKQDLKVEKQTLKTILQQEFGLFKKDSTLNNKPQKTNDTKFTIKWEEADKKEEKKELLKPKKAEEEDF